MSVMNNGGHKGDDMCPLYHFLEKDGEEEEGKSNAGLVPRVGRRSKTGQQCNDHPSISLTSYRQLQIINT